MDEQRMNVPLIVKEYRINEEEFKNKVQIIGEIAFKDACTGCNLKQITLAEIQKLY